MAATGMIVRRGLSTRLPDARPSAELLMLLARSVDGWVTGTARPVHVGRSTSTSEIVVVDDRGRRTCTARLTCLHRDVPREG
jgi:uncharacterized protein (TIGR00369 family)